MQERVGASIVEIITESLYDKPIVVFREYVQNSADSLNIAESCSHSPDLAIKIWKSESSLYFLDNGIGIAPEKFLMTMSSIANSGKIRNKNIGYKGIGRLSGLSYCEKLTFINIVDYKQNHFQTYIIDCQKYSQLRKNGELNDLQFADLIDILSTVKTETAVVECKHSTELNRILLFYTIKKNKMEQAGAYYRRLLGIQ